MQGGTADFRIRGNGYYKHTAQVLWGNPLPNPLCFPLSAQGNRFSNPGWLLSGLRSWVSVFGPGWKVGISCLPSLQP